MQKTALITGSTKGIGKATAFALANKGYTIHLLGSSQKSEGDVMNALNRINDKVEHRYFAVDLSSQKAVNTFLEEYTQKFSSLDVLMLNAGIFPKETTISKDGIDLSFSVGYVSRYLFAAKLNRLLAKSGMGKVVHVNGSVMGHIKYDQLENPRYSKMTSVWQNSVASALLVHNWEKLTQTKVAHMHWNPGIVNTQTVTSQGWLVRMLSKWMGMMEPSEAGELLANHIHTHDAKHVAGRFYSKGKLKNTPAKIQNGQGLLDELMQFSETFTSIKISSAKFNGSHA